MLEVIGVFSALLIWALPMAEEAADDRAWRRGSALAFGAAVVLSCLI